jgi:hypothetical protein
VALFATTSDDVLASARLPVNADDRCGQRLLSLALALVAEPVEPFLGLERESSEILITQVDRIDISCLSGSETCVHPVRVDLLPAGTLDFDAELVVFRFCTRSNQ